MIDDAAWAAYHAKILAQMGEEEQIGKCTLHDWIDSGFTRTWCKRCEAVAEINIETGKYEEVY